MDRFDYTKGIWSGCSAIERMLEKHPEMQSRFTFVQVAAPSRSALEEYRLFQERIQQLAEDQRAVRNAGRPVIRLLAQHHGHEELNRLYRAADACLVTSLHDGMNLVCKEFIAARDDERGVLVLSQFAGAAREMPEALIVNPYHVEETPMPCTTRCTCPSQSSGSAWRACEAPCASSTSIAGRGAC